MWMAPGANRTSTLVMMRSSSFSTIGCCSLLLCLYSPFFEDQVQTKAIGTCRIILKRVLSCTHYLPVDLIMEVKKSKDIYFVTHFVITYTCVK